MAEDHRRVEPRQIVGTGMATDPQRIVAIEEEAARRERAWRNAPAEAFGDVLRRAPARGALADAVEPDPRRAARPPSSDPAQAPPPGPTAAPTPTTPPDKTTRPPQKALPRAPDPRERLVRARLARLEQPATRTPSTDTPPTGNGRVRP